MELLGAAAVLVLVACLVVTLVVTRSATTSLREELARVAQAQDALRHDLARTREASLVEIARTAGDIRGDVGEARRALAEVRALDQARGAQLTSAAASLKRLENVLAGSASRGAAGENLLDLSMSQLPPDLLERNVAFGSRVVEYALRLPHGRLLPIDSKWSSVAPLERLEAATDPLDRRRAEEQVVRELRGRLRELGKYLDPDRTVGLAVMAVPDAVHVVGAECLGEGWRDGIIVVPYSGALAYVLTAYRLALRQGAGPRADEMAAHAQVASECLRRAADEIEGRLSRSLVQLQNGRDALREQVASASRALGRLHAPTDELAVETDGEPGVGLPRN